MLLRLVFTLEKRISGASRQDREENKSKAWKGEWIIGDQRVGEEKHGSDECNTECNEKGEYG